MDGLLSLLVAFMTTETIKALIWCTVASLFYLILKRLS